MHTINSERAEKHVQGQSMRFVHLIVILEAITGQAGRFYLPTERFRRGKNEVRNPYKSTYLVDPLVVRCYLELPRGGMGFRKIKTAAPSKGGVPSYETQPKKTPKQSPIDLESLIWNTMSQHAEVGF
jgi:hypothetical protein